METQKITTPEIASTDIVFDCPNCGKNLAIDERGGGLMITCPGCRQRVHVPIPEDEASNETAGVPDERDRRIEELTDALEGAQAKIERLVEELEETRLRRKFLENLRVDNMDRFDTVSRELNAIQAAVDRIIDKIQEVDMNHDSAANDG